MLQVATDHAAVQSLREGIVIIAVDRPGFGNSSAPNVRPELLDVARDLASAASALKLSRWSVTGYSAGGPFALALASLAPAGLQRVALIASPWAWGVGQQRGALRRITGEACGPLIPWLFLGLVGLGLGPGLLERAGVGPERAEPLSRSMRRYLQPGAWAAGWESYLMGGGRPAGFGLGDVRVDVEIFFGTLDHQVAPEHAQRLAAGLPRNRLHELEGDHYSISRHSAAIFWAAAQGSGPQC